MTVLRYPRGSWLIPFVLLCVRLVDGQSSPAPLSGVNRLSTEQTVVSLLWKNILTQCPVKGSSPLDYSYFYAGPAHQGRVLYEYREPADLKDMIHSDRLSTADKLNGIEWRGIVVWSAGAYRTWEGGGWSEWKGMQREDMDAAQILSSFGSGTVGGSLLFFLEKKRGQWSISIGSIALLSLKKDPVDPNDYWAARVSCEVATAADPFAAMSASVKPPTAPVGPAGEQNYTRLIEDLIADNSKTWAMNRFLSGSVTSVFIASRDRSGRPSKLQAHYLFDGFAGRMNGSVTITFSEGVPDCLYFFDFPETCRAASRRVVTAYAQGEYKNK